MSYNLTRIKDVTSEVAANTFANWGGGVAFVIGGIIHPEWTEIDTCEQYVFATPGTKGVAPINLSAALGGYLCTGSNATDALVFSVWMDHYIFAQPGSKGAMPAAPYENVYGSSAASNSTNMFMFGGIRGSGVNAGVNSTYVDNYIFATPASKGITPAVLSMARFISAAASNSSVAFVFGGDTTASGNGSSLTNTVEQYVFTTPTSKGTAPINLASNKYIMGASGNATNAFVFGGAPTTTSVENYQFNVPATKGTTPAVLSAARAHMSAAGNATNAFTFGGLDATTDVTTCENYQYNVPGTKGTAPAALAVAKYSSAAASSRYFIN
jgi:hypothetical protein